MNNLYSTCSSSGLLTEFRSAVSSISLETTNWRVWRERFKRPNCLLPLSVPCRSVEYNVDELVELEGIESLTVVPKAVTLVFRLAFPVQFHTKFLQASGSLQELGVIYSNLRAPSASQQAELLQSIRTNQNLCRLELGDFNVLRGFWEQLLGLIGSHCSLRSLVFWVQHDRPDLEQVKSVVPFLMERGHLDISFKCDGPLSDLVDEMEAIIEPVRCQMRARALTRESADDRPALFGAALTNWACRKFRKTSSLLSEHADLLCSLMCDPPSLTPQRSRNRQPEIHSLPEPKKQKLS